MASYCRYFIGYWRIRTGTCFRWICLYRSLAKSKKKQGEKQGKMIWAPLLAQLKKNVPFKKTCHSEKNVLRLKLQVQLFDFFYLLLKTLIWSCKIQTFARPIVQRFHYLTDLLLCYPLQRFSLWEILS